MIFCFDLACLTKLAYVPAEAMNSTHKNQQHYCRLANGRRPRLTLDMGDLLLLLGVRFHLVDLVFTLGSDIGRVVTTIVDELFSYGEIHHVGTDFVHKVGRVAKRVSGGSSCYRWAYEVRICNIEISNRSQLTTWTDSREYGCKWPNMLRAILPHPNPNDW